MPILAFITRVLSLHLLNLLNKSLVCWFIKCMLHWDRKAILLIGIDNFYFAQLRSSLATCQCIIVERILEYSKLKKNINVYSRLWLIYICPMFIPYLHCYLHLSITYPAIQLYWPKYFLCVWGNAHAFIGKWDFISTYLISFWQSDLHLYTCECTKVITFISDIMMFFLLALICDLIMA